MSEKHTIVITIQDADDGSVRIEAKPNVKELIAITKRGPEARSMAVAYALSILTHAAAESRKIGQKKKIHVPGIILPPGTRNG